MMKFVIGFAAVVLACLIVGYAVGGSVIEIDDVRKMSTAVELTNYSELMEKYGKQIFTVISGKSYEIYTAEIERTSGETYFFAETDLPGALAAGFRNGAGKLYFRIGVPTEDGRVMFDIADMSWKTLFVFIIADFDYASGCSYYIQKSLSEENNGNM